MLVLWLTLANCIFYYIIPMNSRYYFQLVATDVLGAHGFFGIIQHFGWKKVRLVAQDENIFTAVSACP